MNGDGALSAVWAVERKSKVRRAFVPMGFLDIFFVYLQMPMGDACGRFAMTASVHDAPSRLRALVLVWGSGGMVMEKYATTTYARTLCRRTALSFLLLLLLLRWTLTNIFTKCKRAFVHIESSLRQNIIACAPASSHTGAESDDSARIRIHSS